MKQLSVYVENKVGSIAAVTKALKEEHISIKAISIFDSPDFSILRFVVDDVEKAKDVLKQHKMAVRITDVIGICLQDQPGSLDNFLQICAANKVNIRYMYSFVYRGIDAPLLVLSTDAPEKAAQVFKNEGIQLID